VVEHGGVDVQRGDGLSVLGTIDPGSLDRHDR
jgi:hypothetical protein